MKLHYKRECTSCTNYKVEVCNGCGLEDFVEGVDLSGSLIAVKMNFLIFILEGEMQIIKDHENSQSVAAGEFIFMSFHSDYEIRIRQSGTCIYMSFFYNDLLPCDKFLLESYRKQMIDFHPVFEPLPVREPLAYFLDSMRHYLAGGVNCRHLHALKEKELFIILRSSYRKEEVVNLFYDIIGSSKDIISDFNFSSGANFHRYCK